MALTEPFLKVKSTLAHKRMISVKNLVTQTNTDMEHLIEILNILESDGVIRLASGKGCSGTCISCPSCFQSTKMAFTGDEIVISMLSNGVNEYVDE